MEDFVKSAVSAAGRSSQPEEMDDLKISVVGVGGGGSNTVNRIKRLGVSSADLFAANADRKHLEIMGEGIRRILLGRALTRGLGAGGFPEVGRKAAQMSREDITKCLEGTNLLFLCACMGGGTGTGAAPVFAQAAKEMGAIVISMVTYPFALERARLHKADEGIEELRKYCDSVIILDNNRLAQIVPNLPMNQAFLVADEILAKAISGLVFTIKEPSLVNIDFADVRAIMGRGDVGFISVGSGKGSNKVEDAANGVLQNRLLDVDFEGARGALLHIAGGADLTLGEAIGAGERVTDKMDIAANVKWGARLIPDYEGKMEICAIVTGVKSPHVAGRVVPDASKSAQKEMYKEIEIVG